MSSNNTETAQQRRERLLLAQAERQRLRDEEIARQEAEFAAEMEKLEAEAAKEEEERRLAEERRIEEERKAAEEKREAEERRRQEVERRREEERKKKLAEERELAEAMRLEDERIAELKRFEEEVINEEKRVAEEKKQEKVRIANATGREEERIAEEEDARETNNAFAKLVEENRMEKEKAANKLAKRREPGRTIAKQQLEVVVPPRASGSKTKAFKSKSIISDESDVVEVDEEEVVPPWGVKRKRTIKMIAKNDVPDPAGNFDAREGDEDDDEEDEPPSPSQRRPACTRNATKDSSMRVVPRAEATVQLDCRSRLSTIAGQAGKGRG
ncbi:hypothetical protein F5050DRAFT_1876582 [Lentinula boryana]|uniref:Uncharacterized protein n=1 Tax=Lentinula boryana TaxID=40481 RepID=A0ABQ8PX40_9AGAR|nr:hypothetical protein F5050DRAFT_1876582 [Lentinula boryana]